MAHSPDHPIHMQLPVRCEDNFQQYFTFKLELASFLSVDRIWLGNDFDRCRCWCSLGFRFYTGLCQLLCCKSGSAWRSPAIIAAIALAWLCDSASESGARAGAF